LHYKHLTEWIISKYLIYIFVKMQVEQTMETSVS